MVVVTNVTVRKYKTWFTFHPRSKADYQYTEELQTLGLNLDKHILNIIVDSESTIQG